jgi:hypothetical protein
MAAGSTTTTVRFTDVERRMLRVSARYRGVGTSTYVRQVAIEAAERDLIAAAIAEPADSEPEAAGK